MFNKKLLPFFLFSLLIFPLFSQPAEQVVESLITELTIQFRDSHPDLAFKPNLAILPVESQSPSAREYEVGPAFTALIRSYLERSLLFNLVDDELRDEMIEEIKFSLTGLGDPGNLEAGRILLAEFFLVGSVTELGEDFRLTLQLVSVETGEVVESAGAAIPKEEVLETSQAFTAAYVSPYGLGIEFGLNPWATTMGDMAEIEGQPHPEEFNLFSIKLHYRVRKWLVAWGGLELAPGAVRFDKSYTSYGVNYEDAEVENMSGLPSGSTITYSKDRSPYFSLHLGAGYVWNFTRTLNLTLGADLSMAQTFLKQEYTVPLESSPETSQTYTVSSNDISLWVIAPTAKIQYFVTPRVAFHGTYKFKYQINKNTEPTNYFFQDGSYGDGAPIPDLYNLDPTVDPFGRKHITDMTGHSFTLGVGFYF